VLVEERRGFTRRHWTERDSAEMARRWRNPERRVRKRVPFGRLTNTPDQSAEHGKSGNHRGHPVVAGGAADWNQNLWTPVAQWMN
jgi:hypothetical protein